MEGLFWKKRKRGGALGKIALLPPLSRIVERRGAYGGGPRRRPRAWRRPGGGGKERGERGGSIPPTTSGWGGAGRRAHGGRLEAAVELRGGGAGRPGREVRGGGRVVGMEGSVEGLLIGRVEQGGGGSGGRPVSSKDGN